MSSPTPEPTAHAQQPGKRKERRPFRAPGSRAAVITTNRHIISGPTGTPVLQTTGRTETGKSLDGALYIAEALLGAGILEESDWCGTVERSIERGLARWANERMGMGRLRVLTDLELVYADDCAAFSTGMRMERWRAHFHARPDRPIGLFGLLMPISLGPRPIRVRRRVEELNAAFPGFGNEVLNLLAMSFVSSVHGLTFLWGAQMAQKLGVLDDPVFGRPDITLEEFTRRVPEPVYNTPFKLERALEVEHLCATEDRYARWLPIARSAARLWWACREGGKMFPLQNHHQFISWWSFVEDRHTHRKIAGREISRLERAPTVYTVWDDDDFMTRMVDDYFAVCRESWSITDLTWIHGFQLDFGGHQPKEAKRVLERNARQCRKELRRGGGALSWHDPDYDWNTPLPDGSLDHAVKALTCALGIVKALDDVLSWLQDPEQVENRIRIRM